MSATYKDFLPFYDFSLIEIGVQQFFVAASELFVAPPDETDPERENWSPGVGEIPFFTDFQILLFAKHRPRAACGLRDIAPVSWNAQAVVDSNGQIRPTLYRATLDLFAVSPANYTKHTQLRSALAALADEIAPMTRSTLNSSAGVNQYLTHHQIVKVETTGIATGITPEEGYYTSELNYTLTFNWRRDKLPN